MNLHIKLPYIIIAILLLGGIFLFSAVKIVNALDYPNSDFFTFWLAGHLATIGQNPYQTELWIGGHHQFGVSWIPNATFVYPLPLSLLFAPLGLLSLYHAYIAWVMISQLMIVFSIVILLRLYPSQLSKHYFLPIFVGVVIFRPTILTLVNGQLSGFLLLLISCIAFLWERGKWWQGSVLLPILALKPNLGIPIIVLLILYLIRQKQMKSLVVVGASSLALVLIGVVQNPNWITEFLQAGSTKLSQTFGFSPTVWGLAAYISGFKLNPTMILGSLAAIILSGGCLYLLLRKRDLLSPTIACSIVIATSLLITPYTWPYDQLLLIIPIIAFVLEMMSRKYPFLLTASIFLLFDVMAIILLFISSRIQLEILNVILSLSVYCIMLLFILTIKGKGENETKIT